MVYTVEVEAENLGLNPSPMTSGSVTLGKLFNLSGPQFIIGRMGIVTTVYTS